MPTLGSAEQTDPTAIDGHHVQHRVPDGLPDQTLHDIPVIPSSDRMASGTYVVTRPHPGSGVGSNLASFGGAIWCARKLGRDVIVDWRRSAFLKDQSLNYFTEFFEPREIISGVRVWYAPTPVLPEGADEDGVEVIGVSRAIDIVTRGGHAASHLVLRDYHGLERVDPSGDAAAQFWWMKAFYEQVSARRFIVDIVDQWARQHLSDAFVVGVNLASGNGEFDRGTAYEGRVDLGVFADEPVFLARMERARRAALRGLPRRLRRNKVFFATDSYAMHDLLLKIPGAVTRRATFPPPGVGRIFCDYHEPGYTDRDAIVDAIVDMLLLARCHALIRNGTVFNAYAQAVTASFCGNVRHIERYYASFWLRALRQRMWR